MNVRKQTNMICGLALKQKKAGHKARPVQQGGCRIITPVRRGDSIVSRHETITTTFRNKKARI